MDGEGVRVALESQVAALLSDLDAVIEGRDVALRAVEEQLVALRAQQEELLADQEMLQQQLTIAVGERDAARQEAELRRVELAADRESIAQELSDVKAARDKAFNDADESGRKCEELEEHVARLQSEVHCVRKELSHASEKAAALMVRLADVYDTSPTTIVPDAASGVATDSGHRASVCGRGAVTIELPSSSLLKAHSEIDAALLAEVSHRLREREEAMRLLADGVELHRRARPLERVLAEKHDDEHLVSAGTDSMAAAAAAAQRARVLEAREAQLDERAARLKEKERQLLRVAHELQAKSHALQALHVRAAEREAERAAVTSAVAPVQLPPTSITPVRFPLLYEEEEHGGAAKGVSVEAASPLPRQPPASQDAAHTPASMTAPLHVVELRSGHTQERLAVAAEAYRDLLFEYILETNRLQGCRSLTRYLHEAKERSGNHHTTEDRGHGDLPDMARRTRAMLRALEERLDGSRGVLRGVDPAVQQRSLEAFRKLEKAVHSLCGAHVK
ncbi:hypothetical protein ABL78_8074 [Leptomonas seymouri]|uniref:Uncharacterized protein n=1 Tax=Leptomonas seymouri TaxID=5684 RepID=A0A0N1IGF9_LEPSE|nr:hypothetical protein ABL78_8074 [Leptomonas seymouri]|eukprot:KPI82911.1 hypothetical protein ABL78_8074 [Leptomonas seymouri]